MKIHLFILLSLISFSLVGSNHPTNLEKKLNLSHKTELEQYFLQFPPYWEIHENGLFSGLHYRLAKKIYKHAGLNVDFVNVPYQRMQYQVSQGNVPFINYGEIEKININDILYVCVPPTKITLKVYYVKYNLEKINTVQEFSHKKVILLHGLPLGAYESIKSDPTISFMYPRTIESAVKGLKVGRGDYLIVFDNLIESYSDSKVKPLKSYPLYSMLGYPITTPRTFPNGKELCDRVSASYHQLVKEGIIDATRKVLVSDLDKNKQAI